MWMRAEIKTMYDVYVSAIENYERYECMCLLTEQIERGWVGKTHVLIGLIIVIWQPSIEMFSTYCVPKGHKPGVESNRMICIHYFGNISFSKSVSLGMFYVFNVLLLHRQFRYACAQGSIPS